MSGKNRFLPNRFGISSSALAETCFFTILIFCAASPISTLITKTYSTLSSISTLVVTEFESTKNLGHELVSTSQKVNTLEKKLADAELEITKLRQEAKDVSKLRALLNLKQSIDRKTIGADVIGRSPDNWNEQIIVDKGAQDSVQKGSGVITNQGIVGQIISVSDNTSVVRLISDPESKIGIVIPRINMPGMLCGNYKNPPLIEFIPVGTQIDIPDKVVCLTNGGVFPPGHPVGTVSHVLRDTNGTTLTIELTPADNLYDLTHVLIVPPISL